MPMSPKDHYVGMASEGGETLLGGLRAVLSRLTRTGSRFTASGFVLHDGTPVRSVEVRIDNGLWHAAKMNSQNN
jgi:hypothetical protein